MGDGCWRVTPICLRRRYSPAGRQGFEVHRMRLSHTLALLAGLLAIPVANTPDAYACACCTNEGQRSVGVRKLDLGKREEIGRLRFSADATLFTGEGDGADIRGIAAASGKFELHVTQEPHRWIFDFRDKAGRSGTLSLAIPDMVAIFEVDPRLGERPGGQGPTLYKEWKLTAKAAGTGIFASGMGGGQRLTLILQGHGNSCTSADLLSHWTLAVSGPKANYHLFGEFIR